MNKKSFEKPNIQRHKLLITGGRQKRLAEFKRENKYIEALLVQLDPLEKKASVLLKHQVQLDHRPRIGFSHVFKYASVFRGKQLLLTTNTELLFYDLPTGSIDRIISTPFFNDVHYAVFYDGHYWIVSTGLDMVIKFDRDFKNTEYISAIDKSAWERFSKDIDYRKILSTKPHLSHPNYIFFIDAEPWVTRFQQRDAVCVNDVSRRIDIHVGNPHDGQIIGDEIFFTTTNGYIIIANKNTLKTEEIIDLNKVIKMHAPLGWCRGLYVDTCHNEIYIGFSRLRYTRFSQNLLWIKDKFKKENRSKTLPTRISRFSIKDFSLIDEYIFDKGDDLNVIFGILALDN